MEEKMSATVRIPTPLRKVTNGEDKASVEGNTMSEVVEALENHQLLQENARLQQQVVELQKELNSKCNA